MHRLPHEIVYPTPGEREMTKASMGLALEAYDHTLSLSNMDFDAAESSRKAFGRPTTKVWLCDVLPEETSTNQLVCRLIHLMGLI